MAFARAALLPVAAGLSALVPPPAFGQGLLISPTRIDADVRPGDRLPPIVLSNRTGQRLTVRVDVAPAGQDTSGLPDYDLSPASLRRGSRIARASVRRLRLSPGASRSVSLTVGRPPAGSVGVYGVVAFTAQTAGRDSNRGSVISPAVRLTTNLLLRFPGSVRVEGRAEALRVEQGPRRRRNRTLRFLTRVANDGNLHVRPRVRLTVRGDTRDVVARGAFRPENVLPGAERELPFDLTKVLPAGDYHARVDVRVGRRPSVQTTRFRLIGPNELPTPKLEISELRPPSPEADTRFDVDVRVRNVGTARIGAVGDIKLSRSAGGGALATESFNVPVLGPGEDSSATVELPALPDGSYALLARVKDEERVLSERTVVFSTGTRPGLVARIFDWLAAHIPTVLAVFVLVLFAGVTATAVYIRRLRASSRSGA